MSGVSTNNRKTKEQWVGKLMVFADLPPQTHDRVVCSIAAAVKYAIPADIMLAVAEKEGGKPGQWVRNSNGTQDVGPMQFNTAYLRELEKFGIRPADVASSSCYPYHLAAWRLRRHIEKDSGDVWMRAANYHSRTPQYNQIYRVDLRVRAGQWAQWLNKRFSTVNVAPISDKPTNAQSSYVPRQLFGEAKIINVSDVVKKN